ncbi:MAG: aspartyl protease family protein [Bacteroidales bacterium]|nr:aspartyl protease family protein [Bacteroidales bacterium]
MKHIIFIISISILFSTCSTVKTLKVINNGKVADKTYNYEIPFEIVLGEILVQVKINGKDYRFFFDTGALNIISKEVADALKLESKARIEINDVNNNTDSLDITTIPKLSINNHLFLNQGFGVYDFKKSKEISCINIDGIIGANLVRKSVVQVNMKEKKLYISSSKESLHVPTELKGVPFQINAASSPKINLQINETWIKDITLDYGSNSGIDLGLSSFNIDSLTLGRKHVRSVGSSNVGLMGDGYDTTYMFVAEKTGIGSMMVENELISVRKTGTSTMGTKFLQNYTVTIDWNDKLVYFDKLPETGASSASKLESFGISGRLKDDKFVVTELIEKSSADIYGLQLGDQLLIVGEKNFTSPTLDDYCNVIKNGLFPEDKKQVRVTYKRDEYVNNVNLIKQALL